MAIDPQQLREAVDNCSRDPIHIPGAIQPFGCLLATDSKVSVIRFVSENITELGSKSAEELLGRPATDVLSRSEVHDLRNVLGHDTITQQREMVGRKVVDETAYQITVHRRGDVAIIEFVPEFTQTAQTIQAIEQARGFLAPPERAGSTENLDDLLTDAVFRLRAFTGYDRVKAYRFLPNGAGEVVAEARRPTMPSYLGLRFPASDVPPIARRLYAATPIRVIQDVYADDIKVLAHVDESQPLDMSLAVLRGRDPVHSQYLKNMDVHGTLTVPIVVDGELWGLFAAHHADPRPPDPSVLSAAELAGKLLSLRIQHILQLRQQRLLRRCTSIAGQLVIVDDSELSATQYWNEAKDAIASLVDADGIFLEVDGKRSTHGSVPSAAAMEALTTTVIDAATKPLATDDLQLKYPMVDWGKTGGALILPLAESPRVTLVFVRNVVATTTRWAGSPEKDVRVTDDGPRLDPRNSFELYASTVKNHSAEWSSVDLEVAEALQTAMTRALDTQRGLRDNRHRLGLMVRELNHRVRNILALVQSLSNRSRESATSVEGYAKALEQRIVALAGAHNLLTRNELTGARIKDLIDLEFRPFLSNSSIRLLQDGPNVAFRADVAPVVALLLHELTSNAVKYGALSTSDGTIELTWTLQNDGLAINWRESNGPPVEPPTREGFGRSIIEHLIPYELTGEAQLAFEPTGVVARFWLPGSAIIEAMPSEIPIPPTFGEKPRHAAVAEWPLDRALVVEDNFVIAMQAKRYLLQARFKEVDAVPNIADAFASLNNATYDFCLLDVNVQGEFSTSVARELERRGIPYFFATGYGSEDGRITESFNVTVVSKPIDYDELGARLDAVLAGSD